MPSLHLFPLHRVRKPSLPPRDGCAVTEAQLAAPVVDDTVARVELHLGRLMSASARGEFHADAAEGGGFLGGR